MSSWTLPTIKTNTYTNFSWLFTLLECYYLVSLLWKERIVIVNCYFKLLWIELQLFTENQSWIFV